NHNPHSRDPDADIHAVIGRSNPAKPGHAYADELPLGGCLFAAYYDAIHDPRVTACFADISKSGETCGRLYRKLRAIYMKECLLSRGLFPNRGGNGPGGNSSSSSSSTQQFETQPATPL